MSIKQLLALLSSAWVHQHQGRVCAASEGQALFCLYHLAKVFHTAGKLSPENEPFLYRLAGNWTGTEIFGLMPASQVYIALGSDAPKSLSVIFMSSCQFHALYLPFQIPADAPIENFPGKQQQLYWRWQKYYQNFCDVPRLWASNLGVNKKCFSVFQEIVKITKYCTDLTCGTLNSLFPCFQ